MTHDTPGANLLTKIILGTVSYKDFTAFTSKYQKLVRFLLENEHTLKEFNLWLQEESYDREDEETGQDVEQFTFEVLTNDGESVFRVFDDEGEYDVDIRRGRP